MSQSSKHPKGLYLLFFTGTWERFSYYGMRAILVLYLIKALQYTESAASELYGSFTGLAFLTPLLGGYIADRYWGNRKSIFWGGAMMMIGELLMFASGHFFEQLRLAIPLMWGGLGMLILGNGFFKPCVTTMVGDLYAPNDSRSSAAFTIFYMGINVGAMLSPLICGYLGDTGNPADFKWGFMAAAIGMLISILLFESLKNRYLYGPGGEPIGIIPNAVQAKIAKEKNDKEVIQRSTTENIIWGTGGLLLCCLFYLIPGFDLIAATIYGLSIAIPAYIITDKSLTKIERDRIWVVYIIAFFVIFFWAAFEQAGASLTIFADRNTDRMIGNWEMPASYFQSFNAAYIVILSPIFAAIWTFLGRKKMDPSSPIKQALGLFLLATGYLVIAFGVKGVDSSTKISMMWLAGLYAIHTIGELFLSPIGLSMVYKLSPARLASLMMGAWFLSTATANKFAGMLSALYPEISTDGSVISKSILGFTIDNMYDFFMVFVAMSAIAAIILFMLNRWLLKKMHGIQ